MVGRAEKRGTERSEVGGCIICGNNTGNRTYPVREMMFGFRDPFTYVECAACGGLQIETVPPNLSKYYPDDYHSLKQENVAGDNPVVAWLKQQRAKHLLEAPNPLGALVTRRFGTPEYYAWLQRAKVRTDYEILDVGSGTGRLLFAFRREGLTHLTGVEPYIPHDLVHPNGIRILKRELSQLDGPFDFVLFHHSFEHMSDPVGTLREVHRLLRPDRYAFIRIPVAGCFAWREYRENWIDLDPPRHLWLPTVKGMEILAEKTGFRLEGVEFDSTDFQFWASELYARDLPMSEFKHHVPSEERLAEYRRRADELNARGDGDQACFYLHKPA